MAVAVAVKNIEDAKAAGKSDQQVLDLKQKALQLLVERTDKVDQEVEFLYRFLQNEEIWNRRPRSGQLEELESRARVIFERSRNKREEASKRIRQEWGEDAANGGKGLQWLHVLSIQGPEHIIAQRTFMHIRSLAMRESIFVVAAMHMNAAVLVRQASDRSSGGRSKWSDVEPIDIKTAIGCFERKPTPTLEKIGEVLSMDLDNFRGLLTKYNARINEFGIIVDRAIHRANGGNAECHANQMFALWLQHRPSKYNAVAPVLPPPLAPVNAVALELPPSLSSRPNGTSNIEDTLAVAKASPNKRSRSDNGSDNENSLRRGQYPGSRRNTDANNAVDYTIRIENKTNAAAKSAKRAKAKRIKAHLNVVRRERRLEVEQAEEEDWRKGYRPPRPSDALDILQYAPEVDAVNEPFVPAEPRKILESHGLDPRYYDEWLRYGTVNLPIFDEMMKDKEYESFWLQECAENLWHLRKRNGVPNKGWNRCMIYSIIQQ